MRALSVKPVYASLIATAEKTVELRTWTTRHRGPLLICSSATGGGGYLPEGHALCVVDLIDIRPFRISDATAAGFTPEDLTDYAGYSWILANTRPVKPFPVKGRLSIYDVDVAPEFLPPMTDDQMVNYWIGAGLIKRAV